MADEPTVEPEAPEVPDTPVEPTEPSGPQPEGKGTPAEEQGNWEQRYKDLQSEYTRTSQEAAQLREAQQAAEAEEAFVGALSDPEQQDAAWASLVEQLGDEGAREWAEGHGFEVEVEDDGDTEFRDPRVDTLLEKQARDEATAFAKNVEQGMEKSFDEALTEKQLKREDLPEGIADLIIDAAIARGLQTKDQDVNALVKTMFGQWHAGQEASIKNYRASKRDQPTPPVPGSSGTPNPSLGDRKDRLALANQVAEEALTEP